MAMENIETNREDKTAINIGMASAASEIVQRYGSAAKEYYVAYSGEDNEIGKELVKGLKQVAQTKVNPDYEYANLRQQAGFSAEIKSVANTNAENIIKGSSERKIRTDDLAKEMGGGVNHPLYDTVITDANGNPLWTTGTQMKFIGNNPETAFKALCKPKWQKYQENGVKLEVPSDYYDGIMDSADKEISRLQKQIENQTEARNIENVEKLKERLENCQNIKKNLVKSNLSNKDAMFARVHPKLDTVKSVAEISNRAGVESAKIGVAVGGGVSIIKNIVSVVKGEKEAEDAVVDVIADTTEAGLIQYSTGAVGAALKGCMQNSALESLRTLAKTNFPGNIVVTTLAIGKTMGRYFSGEIDGVECLNELGEQGTGIISSSICSVIGTSAATSILENSMAASVIGGLSGGMIGYAIASASYGILKSVLEEEKLACEERIRIEAECKEYIKLMREYRKEVERVIQQYLTEHVNTFHEAFNEIKKSLELDDVDGFISGANKITEKLGGKPIFSNFQEFDNFMRSDATITI